MVLSILVLSLLGAACVQSSSTPEESAPTGDAPADAAPADAAPADAAPAEAEAAVAPEPRFVTVSVPAGTELEVELLDPLSSGTNQVGDPVRARLAGELIAGGKRVASAGAELQGTVTEVVPLKKFGGQPSISVVFESLGVGGGDSVEIVAWLSEAGKKQAGRDAAKIGGGAVAGAVVGHQVDDDKGAEIGAVVGGAIGTAIAAKTGKEIELAVGTMMLVVLDSDAHVRVAD
jgi:hypothetical protein